MSARRNQKETPAPIGDRLLTLKEAAEVLCLSTRTVREYLSRGEIEGRIIGGRWRFRRADLDSFYADAPRGWDSAGKNNHED
jgi:excisionase family DNA binding protein